MSNTDIAFKQLDFKFTKSTGNDFCVPAWIVADLSTDDHYRVIVITHNEEYEDDDSKFQVGFYSHHSDEIDPKWVEILECNSQEMVEIYK